jgi:hypothetical protein
MVSLPSPQLTSIQRDHYHFKNQCLHGLTCARVGAKNPACQNRGRSASPTPRIYPITSTPTTRNHDGSHQRAPMPTNSRCTWPTTTPLASTAILVPTRRTKSDALTCSSSTGRVAVPPAGENRRSHAPKMRPCPYCWPTNLEFALGQTHSETWPWPSRTAAVLGSEEICMSEFTL